MAAKRDQRLIQSENAIIEAGIKILLFNPDAGMSEIAQGSGVGRTTLYRHFESKKILIQAIALRCLDEINIAMAPVYGLPGRQGITATFELLMPLASRYRFLNSLWSDAIEDPAVVEQLEKSTKDMEWLFEQAKEAGEIDKEIPTSWLVKFYDMTLNTAWSLLESGEITAEQAAKLAERSFFHGCGL